MNSDDCWWRIIEFDKNTQGRQTCSTLSGLVVFVGKRPWVAPTVTQISPFQGWRSVAFGVVVMVALTSMGCTHGYSCSTLSGLAVFDGKRPWVAPTVIQIQPFQGC
ncbi:hypothetical protein BH11BAC3_BH11BAC3_35600 [soil metagenome]